MDEEEISISLEAKEALKEFSALLAAGENFPTLDMDMLAEQAGD